MPRIMPFDLPPVPDAARQRELAILAKTGDKSAREELILCSIRAVIQIARRNKNARWSAEELAQAGTVELIKRVDQWIGHAGEENQPALVTTFWRPVNYVIARQSLDNAVGFGVSSNTAFDIVRLRRAIKSQRPTKKSLRNPVKKILRLIRAIDAQAFSLNVYKWPEYDDYAPRRRGNLHDEIEDAISTTDAATTDSRDACQWLLRGLHEPQARVIRLRFGLPPEYQELALDEIAEMYGTSREWIRQVQNAALRKIWRRVTKLDRQHVFHDAESQMCLNSMRVRPSNKPPIWVPGIRSRAPVILADELAEVERVAS